MILVKVPYFLNVTVFDTLNMISDQSSPSNPPKTTLIPRFSCSHMLTVPGIILDCPPGLISNLLFHLYHTLLLVVKALSYKCPLNFFHHKTNYF